MLLRIETSEKKPGYHELILHGRLNTESHGDLEKVLDGLIAGGAKVIQLNLRHLDYMSSMGLRVILKAAKALREREGNLLLSNLQPQIHKVIEIAGALPGETIFASVAEADEYFDEMQRRVLEKGGIGAA